LWTSPYVNQKFLIRTAKFASLGCKISDSWQGHERHRADFAGLRSMFALQAQQINTPMRDIQIEGPAPKQP
jgi:hypothetical protein